jgi:PAS domain S-box-containing protein
MKANALIGQKSELSDRLTGLRAKAVQLPPEQQHFLADLLDDIADLLDGLEETQALNAASVPTGSGVKEQGLLNEIPCLIWRSGLDTKCSFFNQTWLQFTGRPLKQEVGDGRMQGVHPEDAERVSSTYFSAFAARQPFEMQYRLRHHSGEYRWILEIGRPLHDPHGLFSGYIGTCFDLTNQKQMENALHDRETMFSGLFDFAPDALVAVNQQGRIILVNQQVEQMFGYPPEELTGKPVEVLMPEQVKDQHQRHVSGFMSSPVARPMGRMLELMGRRRNGSLFPVDITLSPLDTSDGQIVLAAIRDLTGYKEVEGAIRERDKFIQTALSTSPIIFFRVDKNGIIRYSVGPSPTRRQGTDPVGKSIYDLYQDTPSVIRGFERALAGNTFTTSYEIRSHSYIVSYAPLLDDQNEINGVVGVATDITAFRQVEDELRSSQARFGAIFDQAHLGMVLIDLDGRVVESNPAFEQMLGCSANDLQQMRLIDFIHPADAQTMRKALRRLFSGRYSHVTTETRYIRNGQDMLWGHAWMSLVKEEDGRPLYAICTIENITSQKQMSAELAEVQRRLIDSREAERLHLSQELHDGPLQELQAVNFVLADLEAENIPQEPVQHAQESLGEVIRSLRVICGELRPPALAPFGLEKAIRSYLNQTQEQHPELKIVANLQADGQSLPEHIRLALFRILQHALKNIVRHAHASQVRVDFSFDEQSIDLEIRDNGRGFRVPKRWIELVREGHYGLVGANERVQALGGVFTIESRPGNGAVLKVRIPRQESNNTGRQNPVSLLISR